MTDTRMQRRTAKLLGKRVDEAGLEEVADPRDRRGRRWRLGALLRALALEPGYRAACGRLLIG